MDSGSGVGARFPREAFETAGFPFLEFRALQGKWRLAGLDFEIMP